MAERINLGGLLSKPNKKKTKRGGGRQKKNQSLVILSANAAGLKNKSESLKNEIYCPRNTLYQKRKAQIGKL
jgi:hypothetical protein